MCHLRQKSVMLAFIRRAEVGGYGVPQPQGDTDSHVAVARKVAIQFEGITINGEKVFKACVETGIVENAVDEVFTDIVGDDGFLKQSHHDEP